MRRVRRCSHGSSSPKKTLMPSHLSELELRDVPFTDGRETIRRGSRLLSRKVGLIRQVIESGYQAEDPELFMTGLLVSNFARATNGGLPIAASGAGDSPTAALVAAFGEAVERHCSTLFDRDEMIVGTYLELA